MNYGYTTLATGLSEADMNSFGVRLVKALLFFVPRANPDNERFYPQVKKWLVEVDDDGVPHREIGIGQGGAALFRAPDERNFGLWVDGDNKLFEADLEPETHERFEALWASIGQNA